MHHWSPCACLGDSVLYLVTRKCQFMQIWGPFSCKLHCVILVQGIKLQFKYFRGAWAYKEYFVGYLYTKKHQYMIRTHVRKAECMSTLGNSNLFTADICICVLKSLYWMYLRGHPSWCTNGVHTTQVWVILTLMIWMWMSFTLIASLWVSLADGTEQPQLSSSPSLAPWNRVYSRCTVTILEFNVVQQGWCFAVGHAYQ